MIESQQLLRNRCLSRHFLKWHSKMWALRHIINDWLNDLFGVVLVQDMSSSIRWNISSFGGALSQFLHVHLTILSFQMVGDYMTLYFVIINNISGECRVSTTIQMSAGFGVVGCLTPLNPVTSSKFGCPLVVQEEGSKIKSPLISSLG